MAEPAEHVVAGLEPFEITFGENQEGVMPLPSLRTPQGCVISRWKLSEDEKQALIHDEADVFVYLHTFFQRPQPIAIQIMSATVDEEATRMSLGLDTELNNRIKSGKVNEYHEFLVNDRKDKIHAHPVKFPNAEIYQTAEILVREKYDCRPPEQADMDFEEFCLAEIMRLTYMLEQTVPTL